MLTNHLPVTQKQVETSWGTLNVVYSDKTAQITLNRRVRSYQFAGLFLDLFADGPQLSRHRGTKRQILW